MKINQNDSKICAKDRLKLLIEEVTFIDELDKDSRCMESDDCIGILCITRLNFF